jgi:hypothetical protein
VRIEQVRFTAQNGWVPAPSYTCERANLVLAFGGGRTFHDRDAWATLKRAYPEAELFGCSTAGEIFGTEVTDDSLVATAVELESTRILAARIQIKDAAQSFSAGEELARALDPNGLVHACVVSDGLMINGSELVKGLIETLPAGVNVTGGLSGDGDRFKETFVLTREGPKSATIAILGFYGERLRVGCGSLGGWDPFGPERLITSSSGNALYELDGKSALELYKRYLGDHANGLPATGLLFPLSIRTSDTEPGVVRTILSVNEAEESLIFAGDVPQGAYARLMKANFDRLIDGAVGAAKRTQAAKVQSSAELAILISCVGRKMVLKQRIEEEVEGVRDVLGPDTVLSGFYSYGEISPFTPSARCELHNQTMTITTLSER